MIKIWIIIISIVSIESKTKRKYIKLVFIQKSNVQVGRYLKEKQQSTNTPLNLTILKIYVKY